MSDYCIVITGLPGSGKSTLGNEIAEHFKLPYFDKDFYLEHLFHERGIGDSSWRQVLSREADKQFIEDSVSAGNVVLVSHWRPKGLDVQFGTPTEWLSRHFAKVVEVFCECPVEVAAARFKNRKRHAGHNDESRSFNEVVDWLNKYNIFLPLNLGQKVVFNSTNSKGVKVVAGEITSAILDDV